MATVPSVPTFTAGTAPALADLNNLSSAVLFGAANGSTADPATGTTSASFLTTTLSAVSVAAATATALGTLTVVTPGVYIWTSRITFASTVSSVVTTWLRLVKSGSTENIGQAGMNYASAHTVVWPNMGMTFAMGAGDTLTLMCQTTVAATITPQAFNATWIGKGTAS